MASAGGHGELWRTRTEAAVWAGTVGSFATRKYARRPRRPTDVTTAALPVAEQSSRAGAVTGVGVEQQQALNTRADPPVLHSWPHGDLAAGADRLAMRGKQGSATRPTEPRRA